MANNPYPIQIKKSILSSSILGLVLLVSAFFIAIIFSLKIAVYIVVILGILLIIGNIWSLFYLKSIEYSFDNRNLTFRGGVVSRFEKVIPYSKIQHIIIYESFFQRIFGIASVSIETARETGFAQNPAGQQNIVQTGPYIPDLNAEEAKKLKNYIISVSNIRYKPVAGV